MIQRCRPEHPRASYYHLRGIAVCERWSVFEHFLADMGEAPPSKSIDRIDNARGYEPGNCRWATSFEQANNTRANVVFSIGAESMSMADFCRRTGISYSTVRRRAKAGRAVWPGHSVTVTYPSRP